MDVPAKSAENQEQRRHHVLERGIVAERISQPLPAEIQPPHFYLCDERRLPVGQPGLPILTAIEVVQKPIVGCLAERAADADSRYASSRLALVDGGEGSRSKRLGEGRGLFRQKRARQCG